MLLRCSLLRVPLLLGCFLLNACSSASKNQTPPAAAGAPAPEDEISKDPPPTLPISNSGQVISEDPSGALYKFTWRGGSEYAHEASSIGAQEKLSEPERRDQAQTWTDASGRLWLFGGRQQDAYRADFWVFEPKTATWTALSFAEGEQPAARAGALTWMDQAGRLHLAGGEGQDSDRRLLRADHWRFDPEAKAWEKIIDSDSAYLRVHAAIARRSGLPSYLFGGYRVSESGGLSYLRDVWTLSADGSHWEPRVNPETGPSARGSAHIWVDAAGTVWMFGGYGYDADGNEGHLNDLWSLSADGKTWQLISGTAQIEQCRTEATPATVSASPMARAGATAWTDAAGQFWIFGGERHLPCGSLILLNDLWKFDPMQKSWVLMRRYTEDPHARYEQGTIGARSFASSWYDSARQRLWIFGGFGYASDLLAGHLRDLWSIDREMQP